VPVRMRKITRGKDKGKYVVVEPDGTRVFPQEGGVSREKAREVVAGRNIGTRRSAGKSVPRRRKSR
jgi:hypothetical protein